MAFTKHTQIHLEDSQLSDSLTSCVFCFSSQFGQKLIIQEKPNIWMRTCLKCDLTSCDRQPKPEVLESYYNHYYDELDRHTKQPPQRSHVTMTSTEKLARKLTHYSEHLLEKKVLRILDYGGGDGSLSIALANRFLLRGIDTVYIQIVDIGDARDPHTGNRILISRFRTLEEIRENRFDIVLASAVLEHVTDPRSILQRLLKHLKTNGIFYARTPSHMAMAKLLHFMKMEYEFGFPAHLHDMGAKFWLNALKHLNAEDAFFVKASRPSTVSSTWSSSFWRTLIATSIKAPYYLFGRKYGLVGGWETVIQKR